MSKGSSFLFEIERNSRQRVVETERVHCISNNITGVTACFKSIVLKNLLAKYRNSESIDNLSETFV